MNQLKLNQYPKAIACLEESLLQASLDIEIYSEQLSFMDADIEAAIASDSSLKNEQMRKARRLEMQQDQDYLDIKSRLKDAKLQRDRHSIQLNLLKNEFSVAKLEARTAIASLEAVA